MTQTSFSKALPRLTLQAEKILAYEDDFVPDQAWRAIWREWGEIAPEFFFGYSFLLLKPETLARRLALTAIDFIVDRGLVPVAIASVPVQRSAAHHIWRFQWNAATTDRVELTNLVNAQSNSLLILLRDMHPGPVPAAVKLWRMKGSAHAHRRTGEHIRTALGMHNRMLGFVHTPDEPADLIRELAIILEPSLLTTLLRASRRARDEPDELLIRRYKQNAAEMEARCRAHAVLPSEVENRRCHGGDLSLPQTVRSALMASRSMTLLEIFDAFGGELKARTDWDALTMAAELIEHERVGVSARLDARAVTEMYERWSEQGESVQGRFRGICNA